MTKDAGTARCIVVPSQSTGSAVKEGQVVFSVLFLTSSKINLDMPFTVYSFYGLELLLNPLIFVRQNASCVS